MQHGQVLERLLEPFDLSANARQLYIASYESDAQSIHQLANKLNLDRSSAYLAIEHLKNAGLVEIDESRRPKIVRAVEPRKLLGLIERKIQNLEDTFDQTHNLLPQLEAGYGAKSSQPILQSYSGKEGLRQIIEDILDRSDQEILLFTNQTAEKAVFSKYDHDYFIRKRRKNNLYIRVIATDDEIAARLQKDDRDNLRTTKILKGERPFACEVYVYEDKVAMLSYSQEIIGFIVSSSDFSQLVKWQFEKIWSNL